MQIPSIFFGKYRDVHKHCRKLAKKMVQGESWKAVFSSISMIDTSEVPGLIVLRRSSANLLENEHFHCYFLLQEIDALSYNIKSQEFIRNSIFEESLTTPWGTLGLFADGNLSYFSPPKVFIEEGGKKVARRDSSRWDSWLQNRCHPMVDTCLKFWDLFYAEGNRYTEGLPYPPRELWYYSDNLRYVLSNIGVPSKFLAYPRSEISFPDKICPPLPKGGLSELVRLVEPDSD